MRYPPFNPFKSPNINFTNFTYNSSKTCQGPYSSYLALQTSCKKYNYNYTMCCDELANRLNVVYDSCINNSLFNCSEASLLTPNEEHVINLFLYILAAIGGIVFGIIVIAIIHKLVTYIFERCRARRVYEELS